MVINDLLAMQTILKKKAKCANSVAGSVYVSNPRCTWPQEVALRMRYLPG